MRWLLARGLLVPIDDDTVELPREVGLAVRGAACSATCRPTRPALETTPGTRPRRRGHAGRRRGGREGRGAARGLDRRAAGRAARRRARRARAQAGRRGAWTPTRRTPRCSSRSPPRPAWSTRRPGWTRSGCRRRRSTPGRPGRRSSAGRRWRRPGSTMTRLPGLVGERDDRDKALAPLGPEVERPGAPAERRRVLDALATAPSGRAVAPTACAPPLVWSAPRRGGRLRDLVHRLDARRGRAARAHRPRRAVARRPRCCSPATSGRRRRLLADGAARRRSTTSSCSPTSPSSRPVRSSASWRASWRSSPTSSRPAARPSTGSARPRCAGRWTPVAPPATCTSCSAPAPAPRCRRR